MCVKSQLCQIKYSVKELRIGFVVVVVVVVVFVMQIDMKKKGSNFTFITEDSQQVHYFRS